MNCFSYTCEHFVQQEQNKFGNELIFVFGEDQISSNSHVCTIATKRFSFHTKRYSADLKYNINFEFYS